MQRRRTIADLLCLFWSLPPDALDWQNLEASGVRQVMLDFSVSATDQTLKELQQRGYGVTLRLNDTDASTGDLRVLWAELQRKHGLCPNINTVILGCEPDVGLQLTYDTPWYGAERAWPHAERMQKLISMLAGPGWKLVTPGWECRTKGEDDPPRPGEVSWRDYVAEAYQDYRIAGHGAHMYTYGFKGLVDELRVKWQLRELKERFHRGPLYLDEIGFASGNAYSRMSQFVAFLGFLERNPRLLDRVAMLCPFVSNGVPNGQWDERWLMKTPDCYELLGEFVLGARLPLAA